MGVGWGFRLFFAEHVPLTIFIKHNGLFVAWALHVGFAHNVDAVAYRPMRLFVAFHFISFTTAYY